MFCSVFIKYFSFIKILNHTPRMKDLIEKIRQFKDNVAFIYRDSNYTYKWFK